MVIPEVSFDDHPDFGEALSEVGRGFALLEGGIVERGVEFEAGVDELSAVEGGGFVGVEG